MSESVDRSSQGLPPSYRLKTRRDFSSLQKRCRSFAADRVVVLWGFSSLSHARLGLTVSRRFGPAVDRNLFRRRVREAFRVSQIRNICGLEINVKPRGQDAVSFDEFVAIFEQLSQIVARHKASY